VSVTKKPIQRTVQIYFQARDFVENILAQYDSSLEDLIRKGRLEHALFMMWASVKNILYRGMVPGAELDYLRQFLNKRGFADEKLQGSKKVTLTYVELQELIKSVRKWAWSLRQSVIPIRGKALEKIVRLLVGDSLKVLFEELPAFKLTAMDTSGDKRYNNGLLGKSRDSKKNCVGFQYQGKHSRKKG
jgi:hypothetical protein